MYKFNSKNCDEMNGENAKGMFSKVRRMRQLSSFKISFVYPKQ